MVITKVLCQKLSIMSFPLSRVLNGLQEDILTLKSDWASIMEAVNIDLLMNIQLSVLRAVLMALSRVLAMWQSEMSSFLSSASYVFGTVLSKVSIPTASLNLTPVP